VTGVPVTAATLLRLARVLGERQLRRPVEALKAVARRMPFSASLGDTSNELYLRIRPVSDVLGRIEDGPVSCSAKIASLRAGT